MLREGQLQRLLRKLKNNGHLDNDAYEKIYPNGSQPARIYGLPKMHKVRDPGSIPPFRPIVSSINAYNYNLSKYLCSLLAPHIPSEHCTKDSFSFVCDIKALSMHNQFMASFDVESLFTNIPLDEGIELAISYILRNNPDIKLTPADLKDLFTTATARTHFLFKGAFYDQIDGVAMGSPLAPVLANLFMGHHENAWLQNFNSAKILFYRRYVDDTFCLFHSENDALFFLQYINSQHPNIKFTMEKESDHKLDFLDVHIDNSFTSPTVRVHRKKTFTGLLLNFFSFTSFSYKMGLVKTLVDRTYKINNTWKGFHEDINTLIDILKRNCFPSHMIEGAVNNYLTNKQNQVGSSNEPTDTPTF
jgi:hypothetical protein